MTHTHDIIDNVSSASFSEVDRMKKYVAIYARRSVEDNRSLSIDSQIDDCKKTLNKEEEFKVYSDNGVSAKNLDRPAFQEMMTDVRDGIISRIVVKKYDRFSRDVIDGLTVIKELTELGVSVKSLSDDIDTNTPNGRTLLTVILGFAQNERENTAARVADAYVTRSTTTGFFQGGRGIYYGYGIERRIINGIQGSVLVPNDQADVLKIAYEMYNQGLSLADIIIFCRDNGYEMNVTKKDGTKSNMDRSHLSRLLKSPLYVRADFDVYRYLVSSGYEVIDDIEAFDGVHGLFRHSRKGKPDLIKVGYHEGFVDAETWIAVQDRKSQQTKFPSNGGAKNSWLVGLVKCGHCNYALNIIYGWNKAHTKQWRYYIDSGYYRANRCVKKRLSIRPEDVENIAFNAMKGRLNKLTIAKHKKSKPDKEVERLQMEILRLDKEIGGFLENVSTATGMAFTLINERINERYAKKSDLEEQMRKRQRKHKEIDTAPLAEPLNKWDSLSIDDKHSLAKLMIDVIYVSDDGVDVRLSI